MEEPHKAELNRIRRSRKEVLGQRECELKIKKRKTSAEDKRERKVEVIPAHKRCNTPWRSLLQEWMQRKNSEKSKRNIIYKKGTLHTPKRRKEEAQASRHELIKEEGELGETRNPRKLVSVVKWVKIP